jgi:hypothetical protein
MKYPKKGQPMLNAAAVLLTRLVGRQPNLVRAGYFKQALTMLPLMVWIALAGFLNPGYADPLVTFDFSQDLTTTQTAARITGITPLRAALSVARQDGFTESVRAASWNLPKNTNYYRFSFAIEPGYVVDIEGVQFDYQSQKTAGTTNGPTKYNVNVGVNGAPFKSISGGWKTMTADGTWHRGIIASNGVATLGHLDGYVTIALAARDANGDKSRWYIDNVVVNGKIRPAASPLKQPRVTALRPNRTLMFSSVSADQFYSVEYATNVTSSWKLVPGAVNLTSGGPALLADLTVLNGPSLFLRGITSPNRLPTVALGGFWRITSSSTNFGNGIIWFDQDGTAITFEQSLLGAIADNSFAIEEDGAEWMSGTVAGDTLQGHFALPLAGMSSTENFQAVRYTGPMYDVWQGAKALTASQYNDPGANGYSRIGQASSTATFAVSQPYLVVCANALAPIDSVMGPDHAVLDDSIVATIISTNTAYQEQMYGEPDGQSAWVGSTYSAKTYRGFVAFGPLSWTSVTVCIGEPKIPAAEPPPRFNTNLLAQTFYLEYDSDGSSPVEDAEVAIVFEPKGVVQLYASVPDYAVSYRGTYTYTNQQLSLKFTDADFNPNVKFALDLTSPKVNMPFDVFTTGTKGPSRWRRQNASISHNLWIIYQAVTDNEQLSVAEAIRRAGSYAAALVQPDPVAGAFRPLNQPPSKDPILIGTGPLENGIHLKYRMPDGSIVQGDVLLSTREDADPADSLQPSVLAGDPRVHLNVISGTSGIDDPHQKTALLISSFFTYRVYSKGREPGAASNEQDQSILAFSEIEEKFAARGIKTERLVDGAVTVENLIRKMLSPGVLYFSTHGGSDGLLATGTYLGTESFKAGASNKFDFFKNELRKAGYDDLLTYEYEGMPALAIAWVHNGMNEKNDLGMIGVTPAFWSWLRSKGTDFSSSLVFIAACHTSEAPALRHAIRARALFSFDGPITGWPVGGIGRYLMESVARRTHTAEETFYNIRRVLQTRQGIYKQDVYLDGMPKSVADHFHGYVTMGPSRDAGENGIMEFTDCGWLKAASASQVHAGDVWWLLFAGRWGQDATGGLMALTRCWDLYWSQSKTPTIGDSCVNCSPGTTPNQDEIAYATYLLTGKPIESFSGITAPRWTLNDGAPAPKD